MKSLHIALFWLSLGIAAAPATAAASAEGCRSRAALEGRKYFSAAYKARQQCQDDVLKGKLAAGTDCATEPKAALRITKAGAKLEQKIGAQCSDATVSAGTYAGACSAAATVAELVTCLRESHLAAVVEMLPALGGTDLSGDVQAQKCRKTAATQLRKVAEKRMKEAQKCEGKQGSATNCIIEAESNAKLAKFEQRVASKVAAVCGAGDNAPIARAEFSSPCSADDSGRFYGCARCNLSRVTNDLLQAQGVAATETLRGLELATGACIPRTTAGVVLAEEQTVTEFGTTLEIDFYRNTAYSCGLSGNYTFLVINPVNNPGAEAPLWVYLHGGGVGYFDQEQNYHGVLNQTEDTWNREETFADLAETFRLRIIDGSGQLEDQTLVRRVQEGYRLVVVSMCDHDLYSGGGTPYPNNPAGGEVNGLQATMAAIDYVAANYPTTHVFAHGTSAGSFGAFSVAMGFALEGSPLTAIVPDSGISDPRYLNINDAYVGVPGYTIRDPEFDSVGVIEKVGVTVNLSLSLYPEAMIAAGFVDTPSLFIGGSVDPFCAGNLPALPEAAAEGFTSNCNWLFDGLAQAVAAQPDSPHEVRLFPAAGHVPTLDPSPANDVVDAFIDKVMATNPPPFESSADPAPTEDEPEALLGAGFACPWDESDSMLHVFLAAGQSNMVSVYGQPGTLPTRYETGIDQLQMWDQGSWKRLGLSVENGNEVPRYGPELAFAWTMHAACPNSEIGIIKYAVGGTSIDTWVPTGENAAVLQGNVTAALLARPDITFEGFLYHQGGGDSRTREQAESWGDDFLSIVDFTRAAGSTPGDLPFLVATPRTGDFPDDITDLDPDSIPSPDPSRPFIVHVVHEQWMVQFERPRIYPTINRDIPKGADGIHDTPEGIRIKGRNFAEVLLSGGTVYGSPGGAFIDSAVGWTF